MPITVLHTPVLAGEFRSRIDDLVSCDVAACHNHFRLHHAAPLAGTVLHELRASLPFDVNPLPDGFAGRQVRLLLMDMDSTLINIECIDEIADFAGCKKEVAEVTEAAMRGEIDFTTSLLRRVAPLRGLDAEALLHVYEERLQLNPGAEAMVAGLKARGVRVGLVSGGFTFFTERLQSRLGLDYVRANRLEIAEGRLTGRLFGTVVDAEGKAAFLRELAAELGIALSQTIAMGDGANDLKMIAAAGLGVAYRAKPAVQAQAAAVLNHRGLDGVLDFLD